MADLIELVAPGGVDEANHGGERYRVDNGGRILVPREAAYWFIRAGGFRVADSGVPIFVTAEQPPLSETTAPKDEAGADDPASGPRRVPRRSK